MNIKTYEMIIRAIPAAGVFIIREDNHEILYFNDRVREVSPHVRTGMTCHELGNHSCARCPLLTIEDRPENQSLCYHSPFGEMVDIRAVRMLWEDQIPAFIITVSPHTQAISNSYHKILRVNLTRDRYETIRIRPEDRAAGYGTDIFSSWLGQFIYNGNVHPEDINHFISFTRSEYIENCLDSGQDILTCCYRRRFGDDFRWNIMEIVPDGSLPGTDRFIFIYIKDIHDILQNSLELDDASIRIQEVVHTLGQQNFSIYGIDAATGETNLVRENGHTHTGWKSWTIPWEEILASRLLRQIHPADQDRFYREFSLDGLHQIQENGLMKHDMLCQWRADESCEYCYMAVIAYFGQRYGAKNYIILTLQNVDKRVRQEHTLSLRDMQLAAILKSRFSIMTTVYPENGQCERVMLNEENGIQNVHTDDYHQYFHQTLLSAVHPNDREAFQNVLNPEHLYQKAASTRKYAEENCRYRLTGSSLRWMEQHVIYARQENRTSIHILGRDITWEKLEEERHMKGEQEQTDIIRTLGNMFCAIYYADLKQNTFHIVAQLPEVEEVMNNKVDYATGLQIYAKHFIHPEDQEEYQNVLSIRNLRRSLSKKQPYVSLAYRKMPQSPDARPEDYIWIRGTAIMSQTDSEGKVSAIVYAAQDVTESKLKEMQEHLALQAACEAADQANASRREFFSSMNHNMRTPMNGIIGMLQIASDHLHNPEKVKDCLDKASLSSRQLLSMLNELIDMSQIKSGSFHLKTEAFRLSDLIQDVISAVAPNFRQKNLRLNVPPMQVEREDVLGDFERLKRIFLNILENSVKYTPPGGSVDISVREHESRELGCRSYDFIFSDTGIGMDEELIQRLFEPFSRAELFDISKNDGTGLGLTIAQNIVRMMGGAISVTSKPGSGSQFTVTVILRLQHSAEQTDHLPLPEEETVTESAFQGYKILLVEDNELNQEIAMELIGEIGAMVECAQNGLQGLRRFAEMPEGYYDLILMDLQMPVMNGFKAARAIRKLPRADASAIPIIALSANVSSNDIAAVRESGMNEHIAKPLNIPRLMEHMDYWLHQKDYR